MGLSRLPPGLQYAGRILLYLSMGLVCLPATLASNTKGNEEPGTIRVKGKHFYLVYTGNEHPAPLNRIHQAKLYVSTADNKPVTGAAISVAGGMPAHKHGLPTKPVVSETGAGQYIVKGIKFSMTGHWELWFHIKAGGLEERLAIAIWL